MTHESPDRAELIEDLRDRMHIMRAIDVAMARWPEVSAAAFETSTTEELMGRLGGLLGLDDLQSRAVMELPLRRVPAHERKKIASQRRELEDQLEGPLRGTDEPRP